MEQGYHPTILMDLRKQHVMKLANVLIEAEIAATVTFESRFAQFSERVLATVGDTDANISDCLAVQRRYCIRVMHYLLMVECYREYAAKLVGYDAPAAIVAYTTANDNLHVMEQKSAALIDQLTYQGFPVEDVMEDFDDLQ